MGEKQFQITDEFDDCFYIREKDNEALTTAKDFENKLNEQYEIIQHLKQIQDSLWTTEHIKKLEKENEQLRFQLNICSDQRSEFHRGARKNANRVGKLLKENERLKEEHRRIIDLLDKKLQENDDNDEYAHRVKIDLIMELKKELG